MDELDERALFVGFRAGDAALTARFFALLMPAVRSRIKKRWKSMRHVHADMISHCADTLLKERAAGSLPAGETLAALAERLVRASALVYQRADEQRGRIAEATGAEPRHSSADPEREVIDEDLRQRVWDIQAELPPQHQRVLEAHAEAELYGKKTMAEILEVTPEAARKMAQRARVALAEAIRKAGFTASDFLEGHDG